MKLANNPKQAIDGLLDLLPVGKDEVVSTEEMSKVIGIRSADINRVRKLLEYIGSLKVTYYKNPREGINRVTYHLIDEPDVVRQKIEDLDLPNFSYFRAIHGGEKSLFDSTLKHLPEGWSREGRIAPAKEAYVKSEDKEERLALRSAKDTSETVAVVGPEPETKPFEALAPLRKSEPRALVEAVRQHMNKGEIAHQHAKALVEAGLVRDESVVLAALNLEPDAQYDAIALVLPYITELENRVDLLTRVQNDLRERALKSDSLANENRKLREQNMRLISEKARLK